MKINLIKHIHNQKRKDDRIKKQYDQARKSKC